MPGKNEKLAISGGEPAVTIKNPEQWRRPVEAEKKAVAEGVATKRCNRTACELIDKGSLWGRVGGVERV